MDNREWPTTGKWLIGIQCFFLGVVNLIRGFSHSEIILIIIGSLLIGICWNLYKFKPWARLGAIIINSIFMLIHLFKLTLVVMQNIKGEDFTLAVLNVAFTGFVLVYLNTSTIKNLFTE